MMCATNDGFAIAEADLRLRGHGDIDGTRQSGISLNLRIARLGQDGDLLTIVRSAAEKVFDADPFLAHPANKILLQQLCQIDKRNTDYSVIS
jgi:ATP-dependent DNA helicase RecG